MVCLRSRTVGIAASGEMLDLNGFGRAEVAGDSTVSAVGQRVLGSEWDGISERVRGEYDAGDQSFSDPGESMATPPFSLHRVKAANLDE